MTKTFKPPPDVAAEARYGLELRASMPPSRRCCTPVGIRRAAQLANEQPVSVDTLKRMKAYFDRHQVDKKGRGWGVDSKGWQAWLLWGGDSGRAWAEQMLAEYQAGDYTPNRQAPGYQSYAWTTQDWRVVIIKKGGEIDYSDKCGAPSNSLSGGRKRLCLPAPVIKKLVRSKKGKQVLTKQARAKEKAPPGVSVRWDPMIREYWREVESRTVKDKPKKRKGKPYRKNSGIPSIVSPLMWKQLPQATRDRIELMVRRHAELEDAAMLAYEEGRFDEAEDLDALADDLAEETEAVAMALVEVGDLERYGYEAEPSLEEELARIYHDYWETQQGGTPVGGRFIDTQEELADYVRRLRFDYPGLREDISDDEAFGAAQDAWEQRRSLLAARKK